MDGAELISDALGRVNRILHRSLEGAPVEMVCKMPTPSTNSMAWLTWHLTRVQDHHISDMAGLPQLWTSEGWHARFGMAADDKETGNGHTLEQVAALKVDSVDVLLGYADAAYERSKTLLARMSPKDLDRVLDEPQFDPLPTVGVRLVSVVSDNTQHAGQIGYLRGYHDGFGWQQTR